VLRRPQLSGVVVLHLLLQRAGCRCRQGGARVYDVWRRGWQGDASARGPRGAPIWAAAGVAASATRIIIEAEDSRFFYRTPPFEPSLEPAHHQACSTSVQRLSGAGQRAHLPRVKSPFKSRGVPAPCAQSGLVQPLL
jgi:hypothetical protein